MGKNNLFNGEELSAFFKKNDNDFETLISNFTDEEIEHTRSEYIEQKYIIPAPDLLRNKTKVHTRTEQLSGQQLPTGTSFVPGKMYNVEFATYILPFKGSGRIFFVKTNNSNLDNFLSNRFINRLTVQGDEIICVLTNWETITGNDEVVETLKKIFLEIVNAIEENLALLKIEIEKYNETLRQKIEIAFKARHEKLSLKKKTKNNLNPFS